MYTTCKSVLSKKPRSLQTLNKILSEISSNAEIEFEERVVPAVVKMGSKKARLSMATPERAWRKPWTPRFWGGALLKEGWSKASIRGFLEGLNCPRALSVWLLFKSEADHLQLVDGKTLTCQAEMYSSVSNFRDAYAATKLLSKCQDLATGIDTEAVAIDTAEKAEVKNRETNERFEKIRTGAARCPMPDVKARARSIIERILGPAPRPDLMEPDSQELDVHWEEFKVRIGLTDRGWSNGRTTTAWGDRLSTVCKYESVCDVTPGAAGEAYKLLLRTPKWHEVAYDLKKRESDKLNRRFDYSPLNVVWGNVLQVVPKNAKTDRVICYEPHMNIRFQLAIGTYMKQLLLKVGVNLYDQTVNQRRAKLGSKYGQWATIDLKSASDMLASAVVWDLLPEEWSFLLDGFRSHSTLWPDGVWRRNQKFSSMGNGFTFELESLIFYALCSAVTTSVSVYGDDIIVPTSGYSACQAVLEHFGFEINTSKSFSEGPFRESCGEDACLGASVTPIYLKAIPKTLRDLVKFHNQIFAWTTRDKIRYGAPGTGRGACDYVIRDGVMDSFLGKLREAAPFYTGPQGYGDGHYHVPFLEAWTWRASAESATSGWEGWWFQSEIPLYEDLFLGADPVFEGASANAALLTATGPRSPRNIVGTMASRTVAGYKTIRSLCPKWPEYVRV